MAGLLPQLAMRASARRKRVLGRRAHRRIVTDRIPSKLLVFKVSIRRLWRGPAIDLPSYEMGQKGAVGRVWRTVWVVMFDSVVSVMCYGLRLIDDRRASEYIQRG